MKKKQQFDDNVQTTYTHLQIKKAFAKFPKERTKNVGGVVIQRWMHARTLGHGQRTISVCVGGGGGGCA